jgi:hypothetical protein
LGRGFSFCDMDDTSFDIILMYYTPKPDKSEQKDKVKGHLSQSMRRPQS